MNNIQISERLITFIIFLPLFFISLAVHEFAHAFSAYKFGDLTAKNAGRLTLNPLKHIDLIGSVIIPIAAFASGFAIIGWAKPIPVNRMNFKNPLTDDAIVSFVGPLSNFILSILFFAAFVLLYKLGIDTRTVDLLIKVLWFAVYLNLFLFAFNLLPVPPLDGSHILYDLFPNKFTAALINLGFYGSFILMFFIYSPLWTYFSEFINLLLSLFIKIAGL
jgi:Zn-dependent protease